MTDPTARRTRASGFSPGGPHQLEDVPRKRRTTPAAVSSGTSNRPAKVVKKKGNKRIGTKSTAHAANKPKEAVVDTDEHAHGHGHQDSDEEASTVADPMSRQHSAQLAEEDGNAHQMSVTGADLASQPPVSRSSVVAEVADPTFATETALQQPLPSIEDQPSVSASSMSPEPQPNITSVFEPHNYRGRRSESHDQEWSRQPAVPIEQWRYRSSHAKHISLQEAFDDEVRLSPYHSAMDISPERQWNPKASSAEGQRMTSSHVPQSSRNIARAPLSDLVNNRHPRRGFQSPMFRGRMTPSRPFEQPRFINQQAAKEHGDRNAHELPEAPGVQAIGSDDETEENEDASNVAALEVSNTAETQVNQSQPSMNLSIRASSRFAFIKDILPKLHRTAVLTEPVIALLSAGQGWFETHSEHAVPTPSEFHSYLQSYHDRKQSTQSTSSANTSASAMDIEDGPHGDNDREMEVNVDDTSSAQNKAAVAQIPALPQPEPSWTSILSPSRIVSAIKSPFKLFGRSSGSRAASASQAARETNSVQKKSADSRVWSASKYTLQSPTQSTDSQTPTPAGPAKQRRRHLPEMLTEQEINLNLLAGEVNNPIPFNQIQGRILNRFPHYVFSIRQPYRLDLHLPVHRRGLLFHQLTPEEQKISGHLKDPYNFRIWAGLGVLRPTSQNVSDNGITPRKAIFRASAKKQHKSTRPPPREPFSTPRSAEPDISPPHEHNKGDIQVVVPEEFAYPKDRSREYLAGAERSSWPIEYTEEFKQMCRNADAQRRANWDIETKRLEKREADWIAAEKVRLSRGILKRPLFSDAGLATSQSNGTKRQKVNQSGTFIVPEDTDSDEDSDDITPEVAVAVTPQHPAAVSASIPTVSPLSRLRADAKKWAPKTPSNLAFSKLMSPPFVHGGDSSHFLDELECDFDPEIASAIMALPASDFEGYYKPFFDMMLEGEPHSLDYVQDAEVEAAVDAWW